jgi:DNA-binding MarR family transcriptional regulator
MQHQAADHNDAIDVAIEQWRRERPELDLSSMGIFGRLIQLSRIWVATIEQVFARHGLRGGEFDVLAALRRAGPPYTLIPSELAAMLMMSRAGMTNRLDRLEAAGLVARSLDATDRRSFRIALTAKGTEVVDAAATDHVAALGPLLWPLSNREREMFDRALRVLLREAPLQKEQSLDEYANA